MFMTIRTINIQYTYNLSLFNMLCVGNIGYIRWRIDRLEKRKREEERKREKEKERRREKERKGERERERKFLA